MAERTFNYAAADGAVLKVNGAIQVPEIRDMAGNTVFNTYFPGGGARGTTSTISTAAAVAYTVAQLFGGLILRDPNGAARADTVPSAHLLLSNLPGIEVGMTFDFVIRNTADAAEAITLTADSGATATISGTATIAQNASKWFRAEVTALGASPTYTIYSVGTFVH